MLINSVNSIPFGSYYRVDVNQQMPHDKCLKRDAIIGFVGENANNSEIIKSAMKEFYKLNLSGPFEMVFDMPDDKDALLEETLSSVGQKFEKVV